MSKAMGIFLFGLFGLAGCQDRMVGQVELLGIQPADQTLYHFGSSDAPAAKPRSGVLAGFGDPVRVAQDVVTIEVDSAYIRDLPPRLTGSKDVVLFAEIQEDAAAGYSGTSLTSIVYVGKNQRIPGRLNFTGNLVYGPAAYKGHPLKIKFTLMVLQSAAANQEQSVINVISNLASTAAPQYAAVTSTVAAAVRDVLLAQPDIVAFDYEATLLSDRPGIAVASAQSPVGLPTRAWLRYGRFVLLETLGFKGDARSLWDQMQPGDIFFDGVALREKSTGQALAANYLVFSVVPGQISEQDATLAAASDQSAKLLASLSQPETQTATAISDIVNQSKNILTELVRSRAAAMASQAARLAEAQVPSTQPERNAAIAQLIQQRFDPEWSNLVSQLPPGNPDSTTLNQIRQSVLEQWLDLYQQH
jgi:hypothetical protein